MARHALRPKLTLAQVGEKFGLTEQAVSNWERDQDRPDIDRLAKLAKLLNTTTDWLLEGEGPPAPRVQIDPLYKELIGLTDDERQTLNILMEGFRARRGA